MTFLRLVLPARFPLFLLLCSLLACSANHPIPLHEAVPTVAVGKPLTVRVIIRDGRTSPPTVGSARAASCVGEITPFTGDSIPVFTASGKSLASDLGIAICEGFHQQHWPCEALESTFAGTVKEEIDVLIHGPPVDRIFYILISDFFTTINTSASLDYDFNVTVWNGVGSFLASTGEQGSRVLDTISYFNPAENAARAAPIALRQILESLLSVPAVKQSLQ